MSAAGRGRKWSTQQFGEKKLETELKFQRWDWGTPDLLDPEPCSSESHHFYLVSWQAESICSATMKSASCVPNHVSHFTDYFKLSFFYKRYHPAGGHRSAYALGKHLSVCTSSVLNLRRPGVPRSTLYFSLA